ERDKALAAERAKKLALTKTPELLKEVRRLLAVARHLEGPKTRGLGSIKRDGYTIRQWLFWPEPGIQVPALDFTPADVKAVKAVVLYLHGDGMAADAQPGGPIEKLVKAGNRVLAVDVRGLGETAPGVPGKAKSYFGVDFKEAFLALHLNRPLLGQRVIDALALVQWLSEQTKTLPIHIIGIGTAGPIALHAAALDDRIREITLERSLVSWSAVVRTPISYNQLTNVVPGALAAYDLPDLAARLAPRPS